MVVDIIGDGAKVQLLGEVYELTISFDGGGATAVQAGDVAIIDEGGYYESGNVEGALQEVGANIDTLASEIEGLDVRLDTAETDISNLQTEVGNAIKVGDNELLNSEHVQIYSDNLFYFFTGTGEGSGRGLLVARSEDNTLESYLDLNQTNAFVRHYNNSLDVMAGVRAQNGMLYLEADYQAVLLAPGRYVEDYSEYFEVNDLALPSVGWVRTLVSDLAPSAIAGNGLTYNPDSGQIDLGGLLPEDSFTQLGMDLNSYFEFYGSGVQVAWGPMPYPFAYMEIRDTDDNSRAIMSLDPNFARLTASNSDGYFGLVQIEDGNIKLQSSGGNVIIDTANGLKWTTDNSGIYDLYTATGTADTPSDYIGNNDLWMGRPDYWIKSIMGDGTHVVVPAYIDNRY